MSLTGAVDGIEMSRKETKNGNRPYPAKMITCRSLGTTATFSGPGTNKTAWDDQSGHYTCCWKKADIVLGLARPCGGQLSLFSPTIPMKKGKEKLAFYLRRSSCFDNARHVNCVHFKLTIDAPSSHVFLLYQVQQKSSSSTNFELSNKSVQLARAHSFNFKTGFT
jgi:hypothetical protein